MATIGVRHFRDHLSEYLRRAQQGERIVIADHDTPVAVLIGFGETIEAQAGWEMVRDGSASWGGGKPGGAARPARTKGSTTIASKIIEDRR